MPELPEVETIRSQLEPVVVGRTIGAARVLDERWTRPEPPRALEAEVRGRRIEAVRRRGKYLIVDLEGDRHLVMHLRMTGNLLIAAAASGSARRAFTSRSPTRASCARCWSWTTARSFGSRTRGASAMPWS